MYACLSITPQRILEAHKCMLSFIYQTRDTNSSAYNTTRDGTWIANKMKKKIQSWPGDTRERFDHLSFFFV